MLFSIDKEGRRIHANIDTDKNLDYFCPVCNTKVILKKGDKNIPHFSHISKTQCAYSEYYKEKASSKRHKSMVKAMKEFLEGFKTVKKIELEDITLANVISDIVITLDNGDKIAILCEYRKIDYKTYKEITTMYNKFGIAILWVFDEKIVDRLGQLASCYLTKENLLYSYKKEKDKNTIKSNNNIVSKEYITNENCIYLNKKTIFVDYEYVIRIGIGTMKGQKSTIVPYHLNKKEVISSYKKESIRLIKNKGKSNE